MVNGRPLALEDMQAGINLKKIFSTLFETPNFAVLSFSLALMVGNEGVRWNFWYNWL
jgi:hypothetical protein